MSIRFKFRSSVNFDSVDIDGRSSISVGELRAIIIRHKNLNICQDFDLVFSDAASGQEYGDDDFQIPSGSSVIIKRVPAGTAPSAMTPIHAVANFGLKGSCPLNPVNGEIDVFADFGADLCPVPEENLSASAIELEKRRGSCEKANITSLRFGRPNLQSSDFSEDVPRGFSFDGDKGKIIDEPRADQQMKLKKIFSPNRDAFESTGLPNELKCPICNAYFKEAVMIPCCQHSFCDKCIRLVLAEKVRCPKCFSDKCKVEDLLPNLSLRQAIERFLESQVGFHDALCLYAPDGESGIQAKEVSCAVTVVQREPELPHSPSATGKGSNQVMTESFYHPVVRRNASFGVSDYRTSNIPSGVDMSSRIAQKVKDIHGDRGAHWENVQSGPKDVDLDADFQGENVPLNLSQAPDEADSTNKKKRFETGGGERNFMAAGRHNKVLRTCYMCGSPDHLIRDCPVASAPHPMLQTGPAMPQGGFPSYASSYWNAAAFPPLRPFSNLYANIGMMPFNASPVPMTPYGVPPYFPPIYGGLPPPGGIMRTAAAAPPVGNRAEHPLSHADYLDHRLESRRKLSNETFHSTKIRELKSDDEDGFHEHHHYHEPERSAEHKIRKEMEASVSHSEDSFARRSHKNQFGKYVDSDVYSVERHEKSSHSSVAGRDRKPYSSERSEPGKEHMPNSSNKDSEYRYKNQNRISRKHHERRGQSHSDSSWGHRDHSDRDEICRRAETCVRGSHRKHKSDLEHGLEPKSPRDQKRRGKGKDSGNESRHLRQSTKRTSEDSREDRWQMVSGSDDDRRNDYSRHKRKRIR